MPPTRTAIPGANSLGLTPADVDAARTERDRLEQAVQEAEEKATAELKAAKEANGGTLPADEATRDKVKELFAERDKLSVQLDASRDHLADITARVFGRDPADRMDAGTAARRGHDGATLIEGGLVVVSMAGRLVSAQAYQDAKAAGYSGLTAWREALGVAGSIEVATRDEVRAVLAPFAAATLEPLVGDDQRRLFPPVPFPLQPPRVLDLITISSTDKDQVDYAVVLDSDGNVTGQPYGTAFGQATITTEARTEAVKRRGALLDVPEGVLSDESRLRTWLEMEFRRHLRLDTEVQILRGDGAGQNFTGITEWAGVNARQRANGQAVPDAIHEAITDVRIAYFEEPDAVAYRPETYHDMVVERSANDGHYVNSGGPFGPTPTSLWGKRAVSSTLLRDGTGNAGADPLDAIVGFFPAAELAVRAGVEVREFEQNKDNVEKGMVTIRGQYRAAFIVNQPVAFTVLDLEEAAP